ncbi:unnamed protein product [Diatraea saccharalis]|uniref:Uncharacterized protein n=1 Tax=Diatraea saccharalis TaxID=40085 RepID=A0A9N9WE17_9NEOP|nr:unnamed protein product [Diatraea saccharalis]
MTVLLYDYRELEERAARHLRAWKVWHLILFSLAAIFGVVNYVLLQNAMQLVDNNCVLFPRLLDFHMVDQTNANTTIILEFMNNYEDISKENSHKNLAPNETVAQETLHDNSTEKLLSKRETIVDNETMESFETTIEIGNVTIVTGNKTHRLVLDTTRTLFALDSECQFAEYMPIMATMCALVWITFFTMCPGGGRPRSGLKQPWRILTPALLFALVLVALTGHSFARTNGGLHEFCAAFVNVTNSTTCSSVEPYLYNNWNTTWGMGARAASVRAASAAVWASWTCVAALLLARCLTAPDFNVKKTGVYLIKDPQGKITPHLSKSDSRRMRRSPLESPSHQEATSMKSEPTSITELPTVSAYQQQDSAPTSLMTTPIKKTENTDLIEMTYTPQERRLD